MDAAAIEVETGTDADAICIIVTSLHCVLEDQGRTTATRNQSGVTCGATDIQCQAGRTSDLQALARIDAKAQYIASLVAAVRRQHHAADHRHNRIHLDTRGSAHIVQSHIGIVAHRVAQNRAVEVDRGTESDAVGIELALLDGQTECQSAAVGLALEECERGLTITQVHLDARRQTVAGQQYVLVQGHGEVEVLPGHIGTICGHGDAGDGRSDSVDAVTGTTQAGVEGVARHVEDAGTAAVEVKAQGSGPGYAADGDLVSARVNLLQDAQAALGSAGANQGKVAQVDAADAFAEGHGVAHAAGIARGRVERDNGAGRRRHGIHDDAAGGADVVQRQVHAVAGRIAQGGTVGEETGHADAIGVVVAGLDGVVEHQRRAAGTRDEVGEHRVAADVQGQLRNPIDQHRFAGVDHEGQGIPGIVGSTSRHTDAADRGHHRIDQHAGRACHAVQLAIDDVADAVAQGAAVGLDGRAKADAIGIELTIGRHQAEHQCAGAAATEVLGEDGAAAVEGHGDARYAASGVDRDVLTEVDGEVEVLSRHVGAAGRHADAGDRGRYAVDNQVGMACQAIAAGQIGQCEDRDIARAVADLRAVERERTGTRVVEVGAQIAGLHDIEERQGIAAAATDVGGTAIKNAGLEEQTGYTTTDVDEDTLVELHLDLYLIADPVAAVGGTGPDAENLGIGLLDRNLDRVGVALGSSGARHPHVVAGDLQRRISQIAGGWLERQAIECRVDAGQGAPEGHGAVTVAGTRQECQSGGAAQRDRSVHGREGHLHHPATDVHVADRDGVTLACAEHQRSVTLHGLGSWQDVDRSIIDWSDVERRDLGVRLRRATGTAVVVDRDRQGYAVGGVGSSQEVQIASGHEDIEVAQRARQHDHTGARVEHADAAAAQCQKRSGRNREGRAYETAARIDVTETDAGHAARHVLRHRDRARHGDDRRIVHRRDSEKHAGGAGGDAAGIDVDGHRHVESGVGRRGVGQPVAGDETVDVHQTAGQGQRGGSATHGDAAATDGAQAAGSDVQGHGAAGGIDITEAYLVEHRGDVFDHHGARRRRDDWRSVDCGDGDAAAHGGRTQAAAIGDLELDSAGHDSRAVRPVAVGDRAQRRLPLRKGRLIARRGQGQYAGSAIKDGSDVAHGGGVVGEVQRILACVEVGQAHGGLHQIGAVGIRDDYPGVDDHRRRALVVALDPGDVAGAAGHARRIVDHRDGNGGGVAIDGERCAATAAGYVGLAALLPGGGTALVPGLEREAGIAAVDAVRHIAHAIAAAQQQRRSAGNATDILPAGAIVHAVLPGTADARIQVGDGDALLREVVHVADVAAEEAGNRLADIVDVAVGERVQAWRARVQHRRVVDVADRDERLRSPAR